MSKQSRSRRARREAKQERQAEKIVKWIFAALILFGIAFAIYTMTLV